MKVGGGFNLSLVVQNQSGAMLSFAPVKSDRLKALFDNGSFSQWYHIFTPNLDVGSYHLNIAGLNSSQVNGNNDKIADADKVSIEIDVTEHL